MSDENQQKQPPGDEMPGWFKQFLQQQQQPPKDPPRRRSTDRPPSDPALIEMRDTLKAFTEGFEKFFSEGEGDGSGGDGGKPGGDGQNSGQQKQPRGAWFYGRGRQRA